MSKSPIDIELDWDNVITYYSPMPSLTTLDIEKNITDEYGPPMNLYSSFREKIENDVALNGKGIIHSHRRSIYLDRIFSDEYISQILNTNYTAFDINRAKNIIIHAWLYSNNIDMCSHTLIYDPASINFDTHNVMKICILEHSSIEPHKFKINIGKNDVTLYQIISNIDTYEEYLNWWCQIVE